MNEDEFAKLNDYLNNLLVYLQKNDSFYLDNIIPISKLNDALYNKLIKMPPMPSFSSYLDIQTVIKYSRELIESINPDYLTKFDQALNRGIIDFSYDNQYDTSHCVTNYDINNKIISQEININRSFNYNDIRVLIHEFMHYINSSENVSKVNYILIEFISIYFEQYIKKQLIKDGVLECNLLDFSKRLYYLINSTKRMDDYQFALIAYEKNGNLDAKSYQFFNDFHICNMSSAFFESNCQNLLNYFADLQNTDTTLAINNEVNVLIASEYKYLLGSILAFYSLENNSKDDIIKLINIFKDETYNSVSLTGILKLINIKLTKMSCYDLLNPIFNEIDNSINLCNRLTKKS